NLRQCVCELAIECRNVGTAGHDLPSTCDTAVLASPSGERPPRRSAAEHRDELAALYRGNHSITSSAATSRPGGTVKPSAFAVFKLMTVSNLVGACTGRSADLSPRKIRSTEEAASRNISTWAVP